MTSSQFYQLLKQDLGHPPTPKQDLGLQLLAKFIVDEHTNYIYLLKGYAGTGKTTMIGTLVKNIAKVKKKLVLTAPTGRAAKVISNYSNQHAQTVHRKIYYPKKTSGGGVDFVAQQNKHKNTIFIVDEASMIPDIPTGEDLFKSNSLLEDLIEYVYAGENCQLIFIGDTAQLPPVKADLSPALSEETLSKQFGMEIISVELDEVVRQELESDILRNATLIRNALQNEIYESFQFELTGKTDLIRLVDGYEIMDAINDAYSNLGNEETAIIVRSNKRANMYNQQIRSRILFNENELTAGDYLMVVKNNYFWIKPTTEAGFIANGDIIEVLEIFSIKELYGFRFAEVKIRMVDYPKMQPFETVLLLDTIDAETPSLSYEDSNRLYQEVMKDFESETSKYKKFLKVKNNNHFNALQVKFSYAITCHKSQGGQWNTVFVEQPYLPNGIDKDYMRWLYTAVTRAKEKLYLIGFKDDFFEE
jgi:exodeoxyribonuclease-5